MLLKMACGGIVALFAVLAASSGALAQSSPAVWESPIKLLSSTGACSTLDVLDSFKNGFPVGSFRPKIQSGEENSALSFTFRRAATIFQTKSSSSQMNGKGSYEGVVIRGKVDFYDTKGSYDFALKPSSIVASTKKISFKGTISDFWGRTGCDIVIQGTFVPVN